MGNNSDSYETQLASACILLSVADADEILENKEIKIIIDILMDFFSINENDSKKLIEHSKSILLNSKDLFEFGTKLNNSFSKIDKIDFIGCVFEVAYADGNLHFLEHHTIKKIANILNLDRNDILKTKAEIELYI